MRLLSAKNLFSILVVIFLTSIVTTTATFDAAKTGISLNLTFLDPDNLHQNLTHLNPTMIRPPLIGNLQGYFVIVNTGNPHSLNSLLLDTSSSLTWIQCAPCNPCFLQDDPLFDPRHSSTYKRMPCNDPLCIPPYKCINNQCSFDITYHYSQSRLSGDLAREMFHFSSSTSHGESITHLGFGCAHLNNNYHGHNGMSTGVLSLDKSAHSFAKQLDVLNQFAYCLYRPRTHQGTAFLRFGSDIIVHTPAQTIPILHYRSSTLHFVDLVDLTIHDTRLHLPPDTFTRKDRANYGGCTISTSRPYTSFTALVWRQIEHFFKTHYRSYNLHPVSGPGSICFPLVPGIESHLVSMTLHFRNGANLYLKPDRIWNALSHQGHNIFCSTLICQPQARMTIIGFTQQIDTWFMFDLRRNMLTFAPADCSRE